MSPEIQNGRFVTRARMSCIKRPRGVKFCAGCWWGRWELQEQTQKEVDSAPGFPDAQRSRQGTDLEVFLTTTRGPLTRLRPQEAKRRSQGLKASQVEIWS